LARRFIEMDQTLGSKFVRSPFVVGVVCVESEAQSFTQLNAVALEILKSSPTSQY